MVVYTSRFHLVLHFARTKAARLRYHVLRQQFAEAPTNVRINCKLPETQLTYPKHSYHITRYLHPITVSEKQIPPLAGKHWLPLLHCMLVRVL